MNLCRPVWKLASLLSPKNGPTHLRPPPPSPSRKPQAVVFLFRFGQDGGSMVVTMADAERVLDTAGKTRLCRREPEKMLEVFMDNCGAGEGAVEIEREAGTGAMGLRPWARAASMRVPGVAASQAEAE